MAREMAFFNMIEPEIAANLIREVDYSKQVYTH